MAARAASVTRVARSGPLPDVDRVAKLIPPARPTVDPGALQQTGAGRPLQRRPTDPPPARYGQIDRGAGRHASTHAAGVVISKNPLTDHVPLVRIGDGDINTQYEMGESSASAS